MADGYLETDTKSGSSFGWDTQTDWQAYQQKNNVAINTGVVSLDAGVFVPSSAYHRHPLDEGSGNFVDSINTLPGTVNGLNWVSNSDYVGGFGLENTGTDYAGLDVSNTSYAGDEQPTGDWGMVWTYKGTDSSGILHGTNNSTGFTFWRTGNRSGSPWIYLRDGSNEMEVYGSQTVDDGANHRIVIQQVGGDTSANGVEMWVDDTQDTSLNVVYNQSINYPGWEDIGMFDRFNNGSYSNSNPLVGIVDNVYYTTAALSSTEISDDYNSQPWV